MIRRSISVGAWELAALLAMVAAWSVLTLAATVYAGAWLVTWLARLAGLPLPW